MRLLNPAESCWEAGEVYPWCLSTCRSPAWSYPVELEKGGWMGAAGVPLTQVCLLVKKKKKFTQRTDQKTWSRAAWLCPHHTVDLLSG